MGRTLLLFVASNLNPPSPTPGKPTALLASGSALALGTSSWKSFLGKAAPSLPCALPLAAEPIVRRRQGTEALRQGSAEEVRRADVRIFAGKERGRQRPGPGAAAGEPPAPARHSSGPVPTGAERHRGSEWTSTKGDPLPPGPSCWAVTAANSWLHL